MTDNLENAERAEMAPKVKPLEWIDAKETRTSPRWKAESVLGEYLIILNLRESEYWSPQLGGLHVAWNTLEAAQAAAQADYEARIRSCLLDKPEAGEVDAGVVERLTRFVRGRPKVYEGQPFNCDKRLKADVRHVLVEIARLRRELEEARKALEPFADAADYYSSGVHRPIAEDALPCGPALIVKHLRAARAALRAGEEGK